VGNSNGRLRANSGRQARGKVTILRKKLTFCHLLPDDWINGAPTVRNTTRRLANYILENSTAFVRGVKTPTIQEIEASTAAIRATADVLLQLAGESEMRCVSYAEFEVLLKRLHDLGSFPTNRHVSDVAHAIHGEELVGRWR
jgi:hypothetical protein